MNRRIDNILSEVKRLEDDQSEFAARQSFGADTYTIVTTTTATKVYTIPAYSVLSSTVTFTANIAKNSFAELRYSFVTGSDNQALNLRITRGLSAVDGTDTTWLIILMNNSGASVSMSIDWVVASLWGGSIYVF